MGVFEHFPYTNFHELNLDYILKKIQKYDSIFMDLQKYVEDQLTPEQLANAIEALINRGANFNNPFIRYGFVNFAKKQLETSTQRAVNQGACCDGTFFYSYRNDPNSNRGVINKYNMNGYLATSIISWTLEDSADIEIEHGNNLFYNPADQLIYCAPLKEDINNTISSMVYKIDPDTLSIVDSFDIGFALWGLVYNPKLKKWAGWEQPADQAVNPKRVIFWDENFEFIEAREVPYFNTISRVGLYGDENYLYFESTGSLGTYTKGNIFWNKIDVYTWDLTYVNTIILPNAEELESLNWTGEAFIATFNGSAAAGLYDYVSFVQLRGDDYVPGGFYNILWGSNELVFRAKTAGQMVMGINATIDFLDPRPVYTATHLEIEFVEDFELAGTRVIMPREYATYTKSQWVQASIVRPDYTYIQSTRIAQAAAQHDFLITGSRCIKINNDTGEVEYLSGDNAPLKIREVRACNYTQQPNISFLGGYQ